MAIVEYTTHAVMTDGSRLVRYSDGVWGRRWPEGASITWRRLKLGQVVALAITAPTVVYGQPGGRIFDSRVREAREGIADSA